MQGALGASREGGALGNPFLGVWWLSSGEAALGMGAQLGQGWPLLECAAFTHRGELRGMEFHLSEKSPPSPCPALCSGRVPVLSLPALSRQVWVLLGAGLLPCPGYRQACESGDTRDPARPLGWGPDKACSAMLLSTVLRATCIFGQ